MGKKETEEIFKQLESGYDEMAGKFSETRKFFWRDLEFIADYIKNDDKILDYGCGNGRLLEILNDKEINYTGVDISGELIKLAKRKYKGKNIKFQKISSQSSLPFPDNYFNVFISIAVFHHFPQKYAEVMAEELFRVIKTGGKVIVTVWNLEQEKYKKYFLKSQEGYIPFKDNYGNVFNRYHCLYTKKGLEELFLKAGFKIEKSEVVRGKNIILIGKK